ncbi:MAG: YesL family protein [Agathobacter sp.]
MKLNWDNPFFNGLGKLVDCAWLSILWFLCCIPIVTIGASTTALYYTVHKSIRGNRGYTTRNFFGAFKDNFKPATLSWLAVLVVWLVLVADIMITRQVLMKGSNMGMFFYFFLIVMLFAIGWACYVFPYIARFSNTVKATLKNGILLELRHLPWSLLLIVILAAGAFLAWIIPIFMFFVPSVVSLLFDLILERIFRRYMSPEDLERELENDQIDKM